MQNNDDAIDSVTLLGFSMPTRQILMCISISHLIAKYTKFLGIHMKKSLITLASLAVASFAQVGIGRSISGIHVPSAELSDRGTLFISGSYEMITDSKSMSVDGFYYDADGNQLELDENTVSNGEALFLSFNVIDNLELNFRLPAHYDSHVKGANDRSFGLGDLQIGAKGSFPLSDMWIFGASTEIFVPSGFKGSGFRPRHRWYVNGNNDAYAYSANDWGFAAYVHSTASFGYTSSLNAYVGVLKSFNTSTNFALWGLGVTILPEKILSVILEISGETPIHSSNLAYNFFSSPLRFTPGLRMHLPSQVDITISGDVGFNYIKGQKAEDGLPVTLRTGKSPIKYNALGTPNLTIGVTLSKRMNLSWVDSDGDGVIDREDMCPRTNHGMSVNERGCPVDEDGDGVLNIVDLCPGTLIGLDVDYNGCPIDADKDGVFDYQDKCLGTPFGFAVDSKGCTLDTDGDGIDDNNDKCPKSTPGEPVDETGCPLDEDHDGITNNLDQCPGTPAGISIDANGCPLDFDKDGVPDDLDKCPNTIEGEQVNEQGCPLDSDNDGVPDSKDQCGETPQGAVVDEIGCRVDKDDDGVFDENDKCPNTPKGAPIDSLGCPLDSDGDGIADWYDQCPSSFKNVMVDSKGCPLNDRLNFNSIAKRIKFKSDTTFTNSSYTAMNDIVANMRQYPIAIEIQCAAPQKSLADDRAKAIFNYLEHKGISEERMKYEGFEKSLPKAISTRGDEANGVRLTPFTLQE